MYFHRFMYQGFNALYFAPVYLFCIELFTYIFPDIMSDTFKVTCQKIQNKNTTGKMNVVHHLNICIVLKFRGIDEYFLYPYIYIYMSSINHMK